MIVHKLFDDKDPVVISRLWHAYSISLSAAEFERITRAVGRYVEQTGEGAEMLAKLERAK